MYLIYFFLRMIMSSFKSENLVIMQVLTASSFCLKSLSYQSTVHCTEILCITSYVMKSRLLFHYYSAFLFFILESMKTSSIIGKSLNKFFQTLYTFLWAPNVFILYNVCPVHQGMFSTSGGVQHIGGYHEYIGGIP